MNLMGAWYIHNFENLLRIMHQKNSKTFVYLFVFLIVPTPVVNLRAVTDLLAGQPLTLECSATAVRGITSSVDISISSSGVSFLERFLDVDPIIVGNSAVYSATVTIEELTIFDDGRAFFCVVIVNTTISDIDIFRLDVIGKK